MASLKISSKIDAAVWEELRAWAKDSNQSISGTLTQAVREYLARARVRPEVLNHLERSMDMNEELGRRLAE